MTTTTYEVIGAGLIASVALIGKIGEASSHIHASNALPPEQRNTVALYYECLNIHLHLSLGMLGLAWSQDWNPSRCFPLIPLIFLGVISKGTIARPRPNSLKFFDFDAFWGLYLPNILATMCVAWALCGNQVCEPPGKGNDVQTNRPPVVESPAEPLSSVDEKPVIRSRELSK
jgi:hypothetical protein